MRTQNDNWYKAMVIWSQNSCGFSGSDKLYPSNHCNKKYLFSLIWTMKFFSTSASTADSAWRNIFCPLPLASTPTHCCHIHLCLPVPASSMVPHKSHPQRTKLHSSFFLMQKKAYSSALTPLPVVVIIKYSDKSKLWDNRFSSRDSSLWPSSQGSKGQKMPITCDHSQESDCFGSQGFLLLYSRIPTPGNAAAHKLAWLLSVSYGNQDDPHSYARGSPWQVILYFINHCKILFSPKIQFSTICQKQALAWAGRNVVLGIPTADMTHSEKKSLGFLRYK